MNTISRKIQHGLWVFASWRRSGWGCSGQQTVVGRQGPLANPGGTFSAPSTRTGISIPPEHRRGYLICRLAISQGLVQSISILFIVGAALHSGMLYWRPGNGVGFLRNPGEAVAPCPRRHPDDLRLGNGDEEGLAQRASERRKNMDSAFRGNDDRSPRETRDP